ncbi:hypothetical protein Tco_1447392 [Tanacetum coccineum]
MNRLQNPARYSLPKKREWIISDFKQLEAEENLLKTSAVKQKCFQGDKNPKCLFNFIESVFPDINTAYHPYHDDVIECLDLVKEILKNIGGEFTNMEILKCWSLETLRRLFNTRILLNKRKTWRIY